MTRLPPPPPRRAQKRSGLEAALITSSLPLLSTAFIEMTWSAPRPAYRVSAPKPPPRM